MIGDCNFDFFTTFERECLKAVTLPHGFTVAGDTLQTRICATTETHKDCLLTETAADAKSFVSDFPYKTVIFASALF